MIPLKHPTVVVPIDFSDDSEGSIRAGLERSVEPAGLHLVHVLYPLDFVSPGVLRGTVTDETREAAVRKNLDALLQQAGAAGAHVAVLIGDPGLKVADYAKSVAADLIVVPSHGHHGVKRLLLGSTAERVIRHAHCSVLVLRRKNAE